MVRAKAVKHSAAAGVPKIHWQVQLLPGLHGNEIPNAFSIVIDCEIDMLTIKRAGLATQQLQQVYLSVLKGGRVLTMQQRQTLLIFACSNIM